MNNLTEIYLTGNNISKIPYFEKNINLQFIHFSYNNIQTIQSNAFYNLPKLDT